MEPDFRELYMFQPMVVDEADLKSVVRDAFLWNGSVSDMEEVIWPRSEKLDWVSWTARCDCVTYLCGPWTLSSVALATVTHSRHKNGTHMVKNRAVEIQPSHHWHVCLYTSSSFKRAQCVLIFSLESEVRNFVQLSLYRDVYKYEHTAAFLCDHISTLIAAWQEVAIHSS